MNVLLPFLAQRVELYEVEAAALRDGIELFIHQLLFGGQRLSYEQAYAVKPLATVHRKLRTMASPLKPWPVGRIRRLTLEVAELVALRRLNGPIQGAGGDSALLIAALGKVHQKATSLDQYIKMECP
jgi:hypothetical protein